MLGWTRFSRIIWRVVSVSSWGNFFLWIDIVLIFLSYSGPSGIFGSGGKQNTGASC